MTIELWIAVISFLTALAGIGKWILSVSYKQKIKEQEHQTQQQERIEKLKQENQKLFIANIEQKLKHLETLMQGMSRDTGIIKTILAEHSKRFDRQEEFSTNMKNYIATRDAETKKLASMILKLNDELMIIKSRKNGA